MTGEAFFYDAREIAGVKVAFAGTCLVPRERYRSFFEKCLRQVDYLPMESVVSGKRVHSIVTIGQQAARQQQALRTQARIVTPDELASLTDRQLLVTTTYVCRNLPARELVTTLNLYFADSATESIRDIEGTDAILMTGFASNLAGLVAMAQRLETTAGESEAFRVQHALEKRVAALEARLAELAPPPRPAGK